VERREADASKDACTPSCGGLRKLAARREILRLRLPALRSLTFREGKPVPAKAGRNEGAPRAAQRG